MYYLFLFYSLILMSLHQLLLFDFSTASTAHAWNIVNDTVMGGVSKSIFFVNNEGHGVFEGQVSLENNGGFSSVRYNFETIAVASYNTISIRLKGDGKRYQLRIKPSKHDNHAYIHYFETTGDWQTIEFPLSEMYPTLRGRRLDSPNFPKTQMEQLAFLIANKKEERFKLLIDHIILK